MQNAEKAIARPDASQQVNPAFVSLLIPCRNEVAHIRQCLESVQRNDYPKDRLEVLVIDGMSTDGTRAILDEFAASDARIRILSNPSRITPAALNIGVRAARGSVIMRMDAHAHVPDDYIRRCVEALFAYGADNVGGVIRTVPQRDTLLGRAIAACVSERFGVGNAYSRIHVSEPIWFPALFCGCYRADVFQRIGLFNEKLIRSQDIEFNLRLQQRGGRGLLVPTIVSTYYARSEFAPFARHTLFSGVWAVLPFAYSPIVPVSWRHLVPLAFVATLTTLSGVALAGSHLALLLLIGVLATYGAASLVASISVAWRRREPALALVMPVVFGAFHVLYGLGSLWGVIRAAKAIASNRFRRPVPAAQTQPTPR
jgi:glycosyltransferase involved in cell wall biosynthesis